MTSRVLSVGCRSSRAVAAGRRTGDARAAGWRPADAVAAAADDPRGRGPVAARVRAVALEAAAARRAAIAVLDEDPGARGGGADRPPQRRASPPAQRDQREAEAVVGRLRRTPNGAQAALEAAEAVGPLALAVVTHEVLRERPHAAVAVGDPLGERALLGLRAEADAAERVGLALDAELGEVDAEPAANRLGAAGSRERGVQAAERADRDVVAARRDEERPGRGRVGVVRPAVGRHLLAAPALAVAAVEAERA